MRVMIIGTDGSRSGASLSMVALAKEARKKGIQVYIVIPESGPLEDLLKQEKISYYIVKSFNWVNVSASKRNRRLKKFIKEKVNFFADCKIATLIKTINPDIIHINTICSGVGALPALRSKKKLVWHIREFVEEDHGFDFWNKENAYKLISQADLLIAISKSVYEKFSKIFPNTEMKLIYNGIDINQFYYSKSHAFQHNYINIFMGGSIAESKGQYLLIEAIHYIQLNYKDKYTNLKVHILGKGRDEYVQKLKELVSEYCLEETIFFDGFKNDMFRQWRFADIAVVASRAEAFGRVTVEAMLSGVLVIGADTAGTAEIISDTDTGLLFKSGDYVSLAMSILYALDHTEEMKNMAIKGREDAKIKYTSENNAQQIIKAYKML